jgi:YD repeat-containing protein
VSTKSGQGQYTYDAASRLSTAGQASLLVSYSYLANSALVSNITFATSGQTKMTTTKTYDGLNRLTAIGSQPSAGSAISFAYNYNSANQRTKRTDEDGSYWEYTYDSLGQVTGGHRKWRGQRVSA